MLSFLLFSWIWVKVLLDYSWSFWVKLAFNIQVLCRQKCGFYFKGGVMLIVWFEDFCFLCVSYIPFLLWFIDLAFFSRYYAFCFSFDYSDSIYLSFSSYWCSSGFRSENTIGFSPAGFARWRTFSISCSSASENTNLCPQIYCTHIVVLACFVSYDIMYVP